MANDETIDVDRMLAYAGDFSRYQIILTCLFSIINILSAFHYFGQTFSSLTPEYRCNSTSYNQTETLALECSIEFFKNGSKYLEEMCDTGWVYNDTNTYGYISIVQELNWVCSDSWKPVLGQSVFFIGSVLGGIVLGVLADNIGRLHVLVLANMFAFVGNGITTLSNNAIVFSISRFIAGCATDANFVMMYIIVMEYLRPSMRTFGLNICIGLFYSLSCMAIPWVASWVGNWRNFLIIISFSHVPVLLFYFIVPESAQWLLSKGRTEEAIKCFQRIAKINRKTIDPKTIEGLKVYSNQHINKKQENSENFFGLVKTPNLRRKTLILIYKSMILSLCYDAISKNVNGVGMSPFVVFTVTSSTILPACVFILAVQDIVGRKALASGSLLVSGTFSACAGIYLVFVQNPEPIVILTLAIVARLGINIAYNSGHQYAVELLPTVVRGQGVAVIHVAGYGATFFSTQILYLADFWLPSPEIILGLLMISGAMACLFLPETLNKTLPVTLADGEEFGEDEKLWQFAMCGKNNTESTTTLHNDFDNLPRY
ncbi:unnamed protein product [Ceutorhynchus assimilis]|uniref:Major facilitator superfamily (MFS) profile domain-containing protein n=1 Tax=Ceutorhynchus assimilis TaxID=467358 RepID=A0A9N9M912_9CUCU|nr:unnamed protein product [Ceutorhynchus assimilis]